MPRDHHPTARTESAQNKLLAVRSTFENTKERILVHGTVPIRGDQSTLFYRLPEGGSAARFCDLSESTPEQLEELMRACQPATFGRNDEDVLDEAYRKAYKMDSSQFALKFELATSGLLSVVRDNLLPAKENEEFGASIEAELYKLNVYGQGSFFKPHKDTPRSARMFGSLVIVFPVSHSGDSLVFRRPEHNEERIFDASQLLASTPEKSVAYVAFFSDTEHEVLPVTSGHRVTLTYNLYKTDKMDSLNAQALQESAGFLKVKEKLQALLDDDGFLPYGGLIGFGLRHNYPIRRDIQDSLSGISFQLRGNDAVLKQLLESLKLLVLIRAVYNDSENPDAERLVLSKGIYEKPEETMEQSYLDWLLSEKEATLVWDRDDDYVNRYEAENGIGFSWIVPGSSSRMTFEQKYMAYGNEPSTDWQYGSVCLVSSVGPFGERTKWIHPDRTETMAWRNDWKC